MTDSASAPLPLSVRNQDGLVCWTKQARLIAQVLISAAVNWRAGQNTRPYKAMSVGTVSLPRLVPTSRGRGCRSGCAGRIRPPRTVTPVGRDDSARRRGGLRPLGEFLSQRWERNQRIAGGDSHRRREQVPSGSSSFSPRPPEFTGAQF